MSYPGYTPTPPPASGSTPTQPPPPPTTPSYPYGAYSYHPPTPGAYSYAGAYQAGVTSYGWTYPYSYVPQLPQTAATAATAAAVSAYTPRPATSVTQTPSATTSMPQRAPTFSSYTPNYARESVPSLNVGGGRGGRRQSNLKGLFTKECEFVLFFGLPSSIDTQWITVKNLMYGFGDDRNPASDTVNVMEEILIEYITDVVRLLSFSYPNDIIILL